MVTSSDVFHNPHPEAETAKQTAGWERVAETSEDRPCPGLPFTRPGVSRNEWLLVYQCVSLRTSAHD